MIVIVDSEGRLLALGGGTMTIDVDSGVTLTETVVRELVRAVDEAEPVFASQKAYNAWLEEDEG